MDFDELLVAPARLLYSTPRLALPAVLFWVPEALALLFITAFIAANPMLLEPEALALLAQNFSFSPAFLAPLLPAIAVGVLLAALWVILAGVAGLWFAGIVQQTAKPSLSDGFSFARRHLRRFLIAWAAMALVAFVIAALIVAVALPLVALFNSSPIVAIAIGAVLFLLAIAAMMFFAVLFWLLPGMVAFQSASGFGALGAFVSLVRRDPAAVAFGFIALSVVSFAVSQLTGALSQLELVGYGISHLILLPVAAWGGLVSALVVKGKK